MFSRKHPKIFHFTPSLFLCLLSPRFHGTLRSVLVFPKKKKKGCTSNKSRRNVLNPSWVQIGRSKQHTSKNKKNISVRLECQARYNVRGWKVRGYASFLSLFQNTRRVHLDAFLSNKFFFLSFLIFLFLSLSSRPISAVPNRERGRERGGERERGSPFFVFGVFWRTPYLLHYVSNWPIQQLGHGQADSPSLICFGLKH